MTNQNIEKVSCPYFSVLQVYKCINLPLLLKQRKNPFNSELVAPHTSEEKDSQLLDRAVDQTQTPNEGEF